MEKFLVSSFFVLNMVMVVAEMQRRQPDSQDVKALDAWLASRMLR